MRIGVTGSRGRLGNELVRRGCVPLACDVTDICALGNVIQEMEPEVIIHCAAKTDVDLCEMSPITTARVNMGGTFGLVEVFDGPIVYISTDYIFDGASGPYTEEATPNPISLYGWSKLGGEIVLKNRGNPDDLIVRTTVLFDKSDGNFITAVTGKLLAGEMVSLPALYGSPTYIPHLARAILEAVEQNVSGVLNLAGNKVMSRFELGKYIARQVGARANQVKPGEVTGKAPRPLRAGLMIDKAKKLGLPIYDPLEGVREVLDALDTMAARRAAYH